MKFDPPLQHGHLIKRYKRFLADVRLADESMLTIHCPNTGSMQGCADPGSTVWYSKSDNPKRKYPHTLELVEPEAGVLIGVNTGRANDLVAEALENGVLEELNGYETIRREVRYGEENSRVDFLLEEHTAAADCYVEVKSVTLGMDDGLGLFPDAVSARGTRHLRELMQMVSEGKRAVLLYCIQHSGIDRVAPAWDIDPVYARTLREAAVAGVEVLAYGADLSPREILLRHRLPVLL